MPASNNSMMRKLQVALNGKGYRILIDRPQFYSEDQARPVTIYKVSRAVLEEGRKKSKKRKLFESASQIQVVLFLRDLWYYVNGWEVPTDNEFWEQVKAQKNITWLGESSKWELLEKENKGG